MLIISKGKKKREMDRHRDKGQKRQEGVRALWVPALCKAFSCTVDLMVNFMCPLD